MPKKNDFKLDVVSVRLVKDAPIYSEHTFNNPADIAAVMGDCMCQFDREVVCVVNLRSDLKPINVHFASVGSLNEAMAHPRELFKSSILSNAASMMLIHCHPSGNVFPSKADTMMTDRMNKLCELMGIPLIDHIIVGGDNREFFSFREKGMIDNPKITLSTDYRTLDIKCPIISAQGNLRIINHAFFPETEKFTIVSTNYDMVNERYSHQLTQLVHAVRHHRVCLAWEYVPGWMTMN